MSAVTLALDFGGEATPVSPLDAPRLLLEQLRRRGVTVATSGGKLSLDAPRGALDDLLPDLQRFKPALLELLESERLPRSSWRNRTPDEWTAANRAVSPGAVAICRVLQTFAPLLAKARANRLPRGACRVSIGGEVFEEPDATGLLVALEKEWTARARACNATGRALTPEEEVALDAARDLLEWLEAARGESAWLDLEAVVGESHATATANAKAMKAKRDTRAQWQPDERARMEAVLRGQAVVANKKSDGGLIGWAESQGLAVGIMRQNQWKSAKWASDWANPFRMKKAQGGSDRGGVCDRHAALLAESPDLLARLDELRGKVLVCCCYPQRCHGDALARRANEGENQ